MKKILCIFFSLIIALSLTLPVFASAYTAKIVVTSVGALTEPPVLLTQNNSYLATNHFIESTGLDVKIKQNANVLPVMLTADKTWFVPASLPANGSTQFQWTSGNTGITSQSIIPGVGGYITVRDKDEMELGDSFDLRLKGWIDTSAGTNKDLILKTGSFRAYISAASTITSTMYNSISTTETLAPNGAGSETNITTLFGAATHWQANLTNNGNTSYVDTSEDDYEDDLYATTNSGIGAGVIVSVVVHIVAERVDVAFAAEGETRLRTNGMTYSGAENNLANAYTDYSTTYANNPQTTVAWTWAEVDAMEIGVSLKSLNGTGRCTQVYAVVTYYPVISVDITPVPSAEYTVKSYCDGAWFMLSLDSDTSWDGIHSDRTATGGASVVVTATDWIIAQNNVMPYITYYKHNIFTGGLMTLITHYQPVNIIRGTPYSTGTVTVTNGDATVEGAGGAAWNGDWANGAGFRSADGLCYAVLSVTDADTLELAAPYNGGTLGGQSYAMYIRLPDIVTATIEDGEITIGVTATNTVATFSNLLPSNVAVLSTTSETTPLDLADIPYNQGGTITSYTTGTASFINGSASVTGSGTTWTSMMKGGYIQLDADSQYYLITSVSSSTHLTLDINYADTGGSGAYTMEYLSGGTSSEDILQSNNILTPLFNPFANASGIPLIVAFLILATVALLAALVWTLKHTQNQLAGAFVLIVGEALFYKIGIYQLWFVIVTGFICLALIVMERKLSF